MVLLYKFFVSRARHKDFCFVDPVSSKHFISLKDFKRLLGSYHVPKYLQCVIVSDMISFGLVKRVSRYRLELLFLDDPDII